MSNPFLSVVIPTYNRAEKLDRCLESLKRQDLAQESFEVLVVDDGSIDSTPGILEKWRGEWSRLKIFQQKNAGQGIARNKGIKEARGQVILFIGDDIYGSENFLTSHVNFHKDHPQKDYACLGLTDWYDKESITPYMHWLTHGGPQFAYHKLTPHQAVSFWHFYTSNISIKKDLLENTFFDTAFKAYGWEDIELGYRLMQKGLKLIYHPEALAYHDHFMHEKSLKEHMQKIGKSALLFQKKQPNVSIVPTGLKKLILLIISSRPAIGFLWILKSFFPSAFQKYYWYLLSKRYLLQGMRRI